MPSLYKRLFSAASAERYRLEEFLKEALCDFLNRLSPDGKISFARDFLLKDVAPLIKDEWLSLISEPQKLRWESQDWIPVPGLATHKRPDIILYQATDPILIVEAKIGAGYTVSKTEGKEASESILIDQLPAYGMGLAELSGNNAALVLLTHLSQPPETFLKLEGDLLFCVKTRAVRKWSELHGWLSHAVSQNDSNLLGVADKEFGRELATFLSDEGLMTEEPTSNDMAAARIFLSSGAYGRLESAMEAVRATVKSRYKNNKKFNVSRSNTYWRSEKDHGWIGDFFEVQGKDLVFAWGVYFGSPSSEFWPSKYEPEITARDCVYFLIEPQGDNDIHIKRPAANTFTDWHFATSGEDLSPNKVKSLEEFGADFTAEFSAWVLDAAKEAEELLRITDASRVSSKAKTRK